MIFNIQRFSTHDGPGIRTIIFFKGCTLKCRWCENPESQSFDYELSYDRGKCIHCLECANISTNGEITLDNGKLRINRDLIDDPLRYRNICPTGALTVMGEDRSIEELIQEVKKDLPFFKKSYGGVTLSGGEPYAQPPFLFDLLAALKAININVSMETSLYADWKHIHKSINYVDTFLADLKHTDRAKFKAYTAGNLNRIIENFKNLEKENAPVIVRVPVIPHFNNTKEEMAHIIDFASSLKNVHEIHFLPFHALGMGKYGMVGKGYDFTEKFFRDDKELNDYVAMALKKGLKANIGG